MLIAGKYELPDSCPSDCAFRDDWKAFGQNAICCRCPVFNCSLNEPAPEVGYTESWRLVELEDYREDWAEIWDKFFKGEISFPDLCF